MSAYGDLARDFGWKSLFRGREDAFACGGIRGWARPASLYPGETRFEIAGCTCHQELGHALLHWRRDLAHSLLERVSQVSREERHLQAAGQGPEGGELSERMETVLQEVQSCRDRLVELSDRLQSITSASSGKTARVEEQPDPPPPLAGPITWLRTYDPR